VGREASVREHVSGNEKELVVIPKKLGVLEKDARKKKRRSNHTPSRPKSQGKEQFWVVKEKKGRGRGATR